MKRLTYAVVTFTAVSTAALVHAQSDNRSALVPALKQGGYVLVVRHGATDPAQADIYPALDSHIVRSNEPR